MFQLDRCRFSNKNDLHHYNNIIWSQMKVLSQDQAIVFILEMLQSLSFNTFTNNVFVICSSWFVLNWGRWNRSSLVNQSKFRLLRPQITKKTWLRNYKKLKLAKSPSPPSPHEDSPSNLLFFTNILCRTQEEKCI